MPINDVTDSRIFEMPNWTEKKVPILSLKSSPFFVVATCAGKILKAMWFSQLTRQIRNWLKNYQNSRRRRPDVRTRTTADHREQEAHQADGARFRTELETEIKTRFLRLLGQAVSTSILHLISFLPASNTTCRLAPTSRRTQTYEKIVKIFIVLIVSILHFVCCGNFEHVFGTKHLRWPFSTFSSAPLGLPYIWRKSI